MQDPMIDCPLRGLTLCDTEFYETRDRDLAPCFCRGESAAKREGLEWVAKMIRARRQLLVDYLEITAPRSADWG